MNAWYRGLAPRERALVTGGAVVVTLLLAYALLIEPLLGRRAALEREVHAQAALVAWMRTVTVPAQGGNPTGRTDSLFGLIDGSARASALAGAMQRIQPEGQSTVRVWMENAPFDALVVWLAMLEREHGVSVAALVVERTASAGRVSVRVTLERSP